MADRIDAIIEFMAYTMKDRTDPITAAQLCDLWNTAYKTERPINTRLISEATERATTNRDRFVPFVPAGRGSIYGTTVEDMDMAIHNLESRQTILAIKLANYRWYREVLVGKRQAWTPKPHRKRHIPGQESFDLACGSPPSRETPALVNAAPGEIKAGA